VNWYRSVRAAQQVQNIQGPVQPLMQAPNPPAGAAPPAVAQQVPQTKIVKINGIEVEVLAQPVAEVDVRHEPLLKKTDQLAISNDKWVSIWSQIETGLTKKYSEVSLNETDLSVLSDTYELVQQNKLVCQHLEQWDVDDVFTLVGSVTADAQGDLQADTRSLLDEWPKLKIDDICKSNVWYNLNTSTQVAPWIRQNLEMSHKFILESCDDELRTQITDSLGKYSLAQKGGPLTFKILMDLVQVNSERAIKHLINSVKTLDAKNFDGENIVDVVAQLRGAHSRLKMVSFGSATSAIPVTFNEDVMDVLQTTSTEEFNAAFDYRKLRAANRLMKSAPFTPSFDEILDAAIDLYNK
jgi:hypothetical protein